MNASNDRGTTMTPVDELRLAADLIEERAGKTGGRDWDTWLSFGLRAKHIPPGTHAWIATVGPHVAGPVAAWLRERASSCAESTARWETGPEWRGVGDDDLPPRMTDEWIRANVEHHWRHELAVARAVLGGNMRAGGR